MILNGTIRNIHVERVQRLAIVPTELSCPDYRLKGNYSPYMRLADFLWQIIIDEILPGQAKEKAFSLNDFVTTNAMLPASLTVLFNDNGDKHCQLVCMDKNLTVTYSVRLTLTEEFFRSCHYGFHISDANVEVNDKGIKRVFKCLSEIDEQGSYVYWDLAQILWYLVEDSLAVKFNDTDEEPASMFYLRPQRIEPKDISVQLVVSGDRYHLIGTIPDGSYRSEASFTLQEKLK